MTLRTKSSSATRPRRGLFWLSWLALIAVAAAGYGFWLFPARQPTAANPVDTTSKPPVAVAVANTWRDDVPIDLDALGTVTALATVTVRARVDGELIRVAFREGQTVRAGDLLAEIDPRPYQAQVQQAQGQLMRDEALLNNAKLDLQRYRELLAQDSIAAQQTATQEALVKQYQGNLAISRAQLANAQLQLDYTRITAPAGGKIGLRLVDQGNVVHASDSGGLAVITQMQPIAVVFTLAEDRLPALLQRRRQQPNLPVAAYDRSGTRKLADGKLSAVDNQIDPSTGTVKLKAQFDNTDGALFPNQFVNVKLRLDTLRGATLAANAAIQYGGGPFVFVVNGDLSVTAKPIKLGPSLGEAVVIAEGLEPGQTLVTDGADQLRDGSRVNPRPEMAEIQNRRL